MASSRLRGGGGISFITSALVVVVLNGLVGTEGRNLGTRRGTAVAPLQLLSDCRTILARKLSIVLQGRFSSSSSSSILRALTVHHAGLRPALCVCFLPSVCLPPANAHEHCCCQLITQQQVKFWRRRPFFGKKKGLFWVKNVSISIEISIIHGKSGV